MSCEGTLKKLNTVLSNVSQWGEDRVKIPFKSMVPKTVAPIEVVTGASGISGSHWVNWKFSLWRWNVLGLWAETIV